MNEKINDFMKLNNEQNLIIVDKILSNYDGEKNERIKYKENFKNDLISLNFLDDSLISKIINNPLPLKLFNELKLKKGSSEWKIDVTNSRELLNYGNVKLIMECCWHTYISGMWTWKINPAFCDLLMDTLNENENKMNAVTILTDLIGMWTFFSDIIYMISPIFIGVANQIKSIDYKKNGADLEMNFFFSYLINESKQDWNNVI